MFLLTPSWRESRMEGSYRARMSENGTYPRVVVPISYCSSATIIQMTATLIGASAPPIGLESCEYSTVFDWEKQNQTFRHAYKRKKEKKRELPVLGSGGDKTRTYENLTLPGSKSTSEIRNFCMSRQLRLILIKPKSDTVGACRIHFGKKKRNLSQRKAILFSLLLESFLIFFFFASVNATGT